MATVRVSIPPNIPNQRPFPAALFTSAPELLVLELHVDDTPRPFGLKVGGEVLQPARTQEIDIHGALEVVVLDWGAAAVGARVALIALPDRAKDQGTVTL
jgi:hypothetical protein